MPHAPIPHAILLFFAAVVAGVINSVAGGGGFVAFPALVFAGIPPINANATNTVALWPGTVAASGAYRRELRHKTQWLAMLPLFAVSLFGAVLGAILLLKTPQPTFMRIIPWLLLGATTLFIFGGRISSYIRARMQQHQRADALHLAGITVLQLITSVYIGYFGAGAGMIMLALFALMGMENIHNMNAFKTVVASLANGVAVITFIVAGAVAWPQAVVMIAGAAIGGYGGAYFAQKLDPVAVRRVVIAIGLAMTAYFFVHPQ
ncbi:MAG: sulfite exporter TauE/SafE family protein [Candidatus Koribacter versatilis]|uniref:Probable membrane transporter protein n=1 Tax=Candidatus Korobacter versatilis TaxID=658062 RepID=A0A932EPV4_9BACT|nr:sulfite exporter TauE/SafE family protein [Candidatus Koribacter versatilis]